MSYLKFYSEKSSKIQRPENWKISPKLYTHRLKKLPYWRLEVTLKNNKFCTNLTVYSTFEGFIWFHLVLATYNHCVFIMDIARWVQNLLFFSVLSKCQSGNFQVGVCTNSFYSLWEFLFPDNFADTQLPMIHLQSMLVK